MDPAEHYCIDPLGRVNLGEISTLIARKKYFVLHAPRQTGKTSILLALQDLLNAEGKYRCLYVNVEAGQAAKEDTARAMRALLGRLASRAREVLQDDFVDRMRSECLQMEGPDGALSETLVRWSAANPQPLVLLIDEIDALVGDTLISVLRQLRSEYDRRPSHFPQSVVLCGVRDVRDYQIYSIREGTHIKGGSAFNIKAESLRLGDFSEGEVRELLAQHTTERGQDLETGTVERVWELTRGQPWLVNALAYEACFRAETGRDPSRAIGVDAIDEAREQLILRRVTHLDQLANTLSEERVRRVIEPLLGRNCPVQRPRPSRSGLRLGPWPDSLQRSGRDRESDLSRSDSAPADVLPREVHPGAHRVVRGCRGPTRLGEAAGGVPRILPRERGALGGALRIQGGRPATAVASVPAPDRERGRARGAGIRLGARAGRTCWCCGRRAGSGIRRA